MTCQWMTRWRFSCDIGSEWHGSEWHGSEWHRHRSGSSVIQEWMTWQWIAQLKSSPCQSLKEYFKFRPIPDKMNKSVEGSLRLLILVEKITNNSAQVGGVKGHLAMIIRFSSYLTNIMLFHMATGQRAVLRTKLQGSWTQQPPVNTCSPCSDLPPTSRTCMPIGPHLYKETKPHTHFTPKTKYI